MKTIVAVLLAAILVPMAMVGMAVADQIFPTSLQTHYIALMSVPTASQSVVYTTNVWLKSIEFIPQSSTSPTCTVQDGLGNYLYNAVQLSPNISYRDTRQDTAPILAQSGITWSCSDSTVKAQLMVMY